jgi:hypothetical protein
MQNEQQVDTELEDYKQFGEYLAMLLDNSSFTDEEKQGWLALLPFMELADIARLTAHLEAQLGESVLANLDEDGLKLKALLEGYAQRKEERTQDLLAELDVIEKELTA